MIDIYFQYVMQITVQVILRFNHITIDIAIILRLKYN